MGISILQHIPNEIGCDPIISISNIASMTRNAATYQRGVAYYNEGRVKDVEFDPDRRGYQAYVHGNEDYEVTIYTDNIKESECDCQSFYTYDGFCKHIVAVLVYLLRESEESFSSNKTASPKNLTEDPESRTIDPRDRWAMENVIQNFRNITLQEASVATSAQHDLHIQYEINLRASTFRGTDTSLCIQLKVGYDRLYVVKNIRNFLDAFRRKEKLDFTKNYEYDPSTQHVDDVDTAMLNYLLTLYDNEKLYMEMIHYWSTTNSYSDARQLIIPPPEVGNFLQHLPKDRCSFELTSGKKVELTVQEGRFPASFILTKKEDKTFILTLSKEDIDISPLLVLSEDGYCLYKGKIHKLSSIQQQLIVPLYRQMYNRPTSQIAIEKEQVEDFISIVLPCLQKEGCLTLDQQVSEQIVQFPLQANIYLDLIEGEKGEILTAKIAYVYGDQEFGAFKNNTHGENNKETLFVRDSEKEHQIMSIFEQTGFRYNGHILYLDDELDIYVFTTQALETLQQLATIHTTESSQKMLSQPRRQPVARIDMNPTTHWLDFHFDVPDMDQNELQEIMKAFLDRKKYHRLSDGSFVSLQGEGTDQLRALLNEEGGQRTIIDGHKIKLPAYRALQFEELSQNHQEMKMKTGQLFRKLVRHLKDPESLEFTIPKPMDEVLRDYQRFGFHWLKTMAHYGFGGILADDMGLGKTLQTLSLVASQVEKPKEKPPVENAVCLPVLVVTPASLVYNWEKECAHFAPQLRTILITGDKEERHQLLKNLKDTDMVITSYPLLRRDIEQYTPYFFETLILDEAQFCKNRQSQTARSIQDIRFGTCFALSGTPIENNLDELWSIFNIVLPGLFPNQKTFRKLPLENIAQRVKPFILRRMKKDVLTELPDKIESIQFSEMTVEQKKLYLATLASIQKDAQQSIQSEGFQKSRMKILAGLTRLRQICCHPVLYAGDYNSDSGKLNQFLELLQDLLENNRRILVFSQFTSMLAVIQDHLKELDLPFHYLHGGTPSKERIDMVNRFNAGEKDIFLISLKAGGTGLNLIGADTVILYDLWWNPAVEQQAADRAYRMGQKKNVHVFKMIAKGTIEEKIYELQQKKTALLEKVIQPGEQMLSSLSEEDIKVLLDLP